MKDRRELGRHFTLARLARDVFDANRQLSPPPATGGVGATADAVSGLLDEIGPAVQQMRARGADADEIRRILAGWVH